MAHKFDATMKDLARERPLDFVWFFDKPTQASVSVLNVDLSTITTSADFVVGIGDPLKEILHIDFQSSADGKKQLDILVHNTVLYKHFEVPVHSIVLLLRPQARHSKVNGTVSYAARPGHGKMQFDFQIVQLWDIPAADFLDGPLGILPLAVLGQFPEEQTVEAGLSGVIRQLVDRIVQEAEPEQKTGLMMASFLLSGLRVNKQRAKQIFQRIPVMEESSTYMWILEEGEVKGLRRTLLMQGQILFGAPDDSVKTRIEGIEELDTLYHLLKRVHGASSWSELLSDVN